MLLVAAALSASPGAPTFVDAGSGAIEAPISGTFQLPYPATVANGNFLLAHVYAKDATTADISLPSGWTSVNFRASTDTLVYSRAFYKVADGTETGNLNVTATASAFVAGRMYRFSNGTAVEATGSANTDGSGTGLTCVDVTTLGSNRCAVQLFGAVVDQTVTNVSGETNADYTEAVAEYRSASGPVTLSCQVAAVTSAIAISGGSATLGGAGTYRQRHGFAIVP